MNEIEQKQKTNTSFLDAGRGSPTPSETFRTGSETRVRPEISNAITDDPVLDVRRATFHYIFTHPLFYFSTFLILLGGIAFGYYTADYLDAVIITLVLFFALYAIVMKRIRDAFMEQFAKSIGYEFALSSDVAGVDGALFRVGHDRGISDVASGMNGGRPVRVFYYSYTVGEGKSAQVHPFTVFECTFESTMPHIMLHRPDGIFSGDVPVFSGGVDLTLEGDFNKYFSLAVEKEFELEAYQIFTPDIMQDLIDTSKRTGFEFLHNKLYIYKDKLIEKRAELDALFALSNKLCTRLEPVIKGMKGDVEAIKRLK